MVESGLRLSKEEKERRKEERRRKKYDETHKFIEGIEYKLCSDCNEWLPCDIDYFYKNNSNGIDGFNPYCKECTVIRSRKWRMDNYEQYQTINNKYIKDNEEYFKNYKKEWYQEKKDERREHLRNWQQNNPNKLKQYNYSRNQRKKHKISKKEWLACKKYFIFRCAYCGLHQEEHFRIWKGKPKKIDLHKEHVDDNGANDLSNCIPSCQSCNSSKHTFNFETWYKDYEHFDEERYNKILKWLSEDYLKYINIK